MKKTRISQQKITAYNFFFIPVTFSMAAQLFQIAFMVFIDEGNLVKAATPFTLAVL